MDKSAMLLTIIDHYTDGNKARFASMIGVSPQTLSKWIARNTFDAEILFANCPDISPAWLLSGKGEVISCHCGNFQNGNSQELIELCRLLVENYKQRDEVVARLTSMLDQ